MIFWSLIFALGAGLNIALGWAGWPAVLSGHLAGPDSYMRLVRLLQGIHHGHLVNIAEGDQSGAGLLLDWSRLFDMLLWLLAAPLAAFIGWRDALFAVGVGFGPLSAGLLGLALAFAARPFAEDRLLWTAAPAASVFPALLALAPPGAVQSATLTMAMLAGAFGCTVRAWRGATGQAFLGGMLAAFALWLTPASLPVIVLGFLPLALRWWRAPIGAAIAAATAGFFDVIGFGFAIDPPQGGYAVPDLHRLSLIYLAFAFLTLFAGTTIWRLQGWKHVRWRRPAGAAVLVGVLLVWLLLFPQIVLQIYHFLAVQMRAAMPGQTSELVAGALGLAYAIWRYAAGRTWPSLYFAVCLLLALVLGWRLPEAAALAAVIAAGLVPVGLSELNRHFSTRPATGRVAWVAGLATILLVAVLPELAAGEPMFVGPSGPPACDLRGIGAVLRPDTGQIALAPPAATPELLYRTGIKTVGSLYPAGQAGFDRAMAAWRSPPAAAPSPALRLTGARLVLFCRAPKPLAGPGSLWDALDHGAIPAWLALQAQTPAGWQVFAIR